MVSCVYPVKNVRDPTTAKAYACLQRVVFVEEMGFGEVIVEGIQWLSLKKYRVEQTKRRTGGCMGERMLLPDLMDGRNSTGGWTYRFEGPKGKKLEEAETMFW